MPIEEVASWSWRKRWFYYDSLVALDEQEQEAMPDMNGGGMPNSGSMPSGMGGNMTGGSTKDVPQSVGSHENVIKSQSH